MKKLILLFAGLAFLVITSQAQTVTDYDGNVYTTVTIGTQKWLKENLKVTHYRNGVSIPNVTDSATWLGLTTGAYCCYDNNCPVNGTTYGNLYNWYAVDDPNGICPTNWHVPTHDEWTTLERAVCISTSCATDFPYNLFTTGGRGTYEANYLKEAGNSHWWNNLSVVTNSSGFTALPGGTRSGQSGGSNPLFLLIKTNGVWWTATQNGTNQAWNRSMVYNTAFIYRGNNATKRMGYSLRCVCDSVAAHINDFYNNINIQIYPNPANDMVYIDCVGQRDVRMKIFNIMGECVMQRELSTGISDIDVSSLSKGIYLIKTTGIDWTGQKIIIKE